jgi:uncharacterized membrane protein YjjB (DUF3815 family)
MILNSLYTLIATFCFSILTNVRGKNLIFASLGGGITWLIYLFTYSNLHISNTFSFFIASVFAAAYSEMMARVLRTPVTTFLISAIIPLVPGSGMYYTMFESVQGKVNSSLNLGIQTLTIAGTIAIGVFFVSSIAKALFLLKKMILEKCSTPKTK